MQKRRARIAPAVGTAVIAALQAAPARHPSANRRRALMASAAFVSAVLRVPATNPACTAMVSQARQPGSRSNSLAICGAAAVAENHNVMPRISAAATSSSIRRGV